MFQIKHIEKLMLVAALVALTGCAATTPMASKTQDADSKIFKAPPSNLSGIYVYRNSSFGAANKKRISIDNVVIGASAKYTFFHKLVSPGTHTISTESEFGDNSVQLNAAPGKNYFFHQYIKLGAFTAGANIEAVSEEDGKEGVLECNEADSAELK
jgi:hypothetical protein